MNDLLAQSSFSMVLVFFGLFFFGITALFLAVGFTFERSRFGRSHRVFDLPLRKNQLRIEALSNVRFNIVSTLVICGVVYAGLVPAVPFSWTGAVVTFFACHFAFEAWYYVMHRLLHTRLLVRFHRYHHYSQVTTPLTGLSMSTIETLGWIGGFLVVPLVCAYGLPFVYEGWLLYLVINWAGNVVGHANAEYFPLNMRDRRSSWMGHPITYHSLHHARFENHYAFGMTFFDRVLGTEWADWPALFARVRQGQPLRRLSERGGHSAGETAPATPAPERAG